MISKQIRGSIVDIFGRRIFKGSVTIAGGLISDIRCEAVLFSGEDDCPDGGPVRAAGHDFRSRGDPSALPGPFILPGFLEAHIHIESTMLTPAEYSRAVVGCGVTGSFSDPHEIANVCGLSGIRFMAENAAQTPYPIWFGAPSCVPSTPFETYGAVIGPEDISLMLSDVSDGGFGFRYLGEMMNYPGVLADDPAVVKKIKAAQDLGKPIDGHAPGLCGNDLVRYVRAGISTDHECSSLEEAVEKAGLGMAVMIREGSAAKNFTVLEKMIALHPDKSMFCTDDCHPGDLSKGTVQNLVRRAVADGFDLFDVLRVACVNPAVHFGLTPAEHGLLQTGDSADLIVVSDLKSFGVLETYIGGRCVFDRSLEKEGKSAVLIPPVQTVPINVFETVPRKLSDLKIRTSRPDGPAAVSVIETIPGQILTKKTICSLPVKKGEIFPDPANDVLKIVAVDRYHPPSSGNPRLYAAFAKGLGLKEGAVASSVSHDCHNIIAAGADDDCLLEAINLIIENKGGLCAAASSGRHEILPLPIAGLMSPQTKDEVAAAEKSLYDFARDIGLAEDGFMTLSFMALLVIPELRICPDGLFDASAFSFTGLEE